MTEQISSPVAPVTYLLGGLISPYPFRSRYFANCRRARC